MKLFRHLMPRSMDDNKIVTSYCVGEQLGPQYYLVFLLNRGKVITYIKRKCIYNQIVIVSSNRISSQIGWLVKCFNNSSNNYPDTPIPMITNDNIKHECNIAISIYTVAISHTLAVWIGWRWVCVVCQRHMLPTAIYCQSFYWRVGSDFMVWCIQMPDCWESCIPKSLLQVSTFWWWFLSLGKIFINRSPFALIWFNFDKHQLTVKSLI